ncbi:MAG: hypothetical protein BRD42_06875 [Bacteroidetes bacterium QS_3_64_15]|nr:MAG: hypothetical protein BRD42_06875 [Bacteroidetes bacterium QS_3_64_15]
MLDDDSLAKMETAVRACDEAREALIDALDADDATSTPSVLDPVGTALEDWRDAQQRFMALVDASNASDPATAALLLKTNHGIDASNARCGLPGTDVDGADQPFPLDLTGAQGMILTQAATEHLR